MEMLPSTKSAFMNCLILAVFSIFAAAQNPPNPCSSKLNCHDCIQTPSCAWCYDPDYKYTRCFLPSVAAQQNAECAEEFTLNPDTVYSKIINEELTKAHRRTGEGGLLVSGYEGNYNYSEQWEQHGYDQSQSGGGYGGGGGGQIVQMRPQRVRLQLRARQSYSIFMNYTQAEDYPVDLYYLMDLSKSMADDKEKLSQLGNQLATTMRRLTTNFRLGFGSFVDKVVMPYVSTLPENLQNPCDKRETCAPPYGYKHAMSLSTNTNQFSFMVKEANVSGNLDAPEGGFDAIMQAVVCRNQIGWREQARRLLVFSTDASFHYAGDGKLGGIVKPNDGLCHLSTEGYYSQSSYQDYPSIEQINLSVKKNSINVIFAVTKSTIEVYRQLAKNIEGASVGELEGDSSNIVSLIKEQYEQISSTVEMKHNASAAVSIKFFTRCLNSTGALVNTNKCGNIKVGDIINFKVDIEVLKCPKNREDYFQTIQIYPVGINESLIIDLEMLCDCPCERQGDKYYQEFAPYCHHHGTYKCGICECIPGAFGRQCQCDTEKYNTTITNCVNPMGPPDVECSGRGQCVCGHCECDTRQNDNEIISGEYCECDNFSCERHDGKLCSGTDHGYCECGLCHCTDEWQGTNCACKKSNETCIMPGDISGKMCSGHGYCECGICKCDSDKDGRYTGKFCEKCPTCSDKCAEYKNCVDCYQYKTGPLTENPKDCAIYCDHLNFTIVKEVEVIEENFEVLCQYQDEKRCTYSYVYYFDNNNNVQIRVQEEKNCPAEIYIVGLILGVIAAILLIGMAILLLWKILTTIHDRREFAKFEKERMRARWDTGENPIYKQATSTFKNPTYAGLKH